ncbi:ACP S-malonyltransferase [Streptomyces sp. NA02950]|uniref:ACP S-malonyltransferase n=1 Tax=Streptomyces sp. NA02950 TaxID=2742137 RepID=UPI001591D908|nr:ACP S-malonyltransferase [Streptomyces sp. NA02950]QKV96577.1 ACP S-malonyltransferase [Streptomyces sp. NA02950]
MGSETALVFPGMGPSAFSDVGRFMVVNPYARELVAIADEVLGYSLLDTFRRTEGDYSEAAQVAFLVNCLASAHWARESLGLEPALCTGPSFGEKAALAWCGVLPPDEAIRLTAELARCMDAYFAVEHRDIVTLSFVRTPREKLDEILADFEADGEWHDISCYVDDGFFMVSLRETRVEWMEQRLRAVGGMPLYTMRPPMHAAAFGPLRDKAEREVLAGFDFADPRLPIVADQDGRPLRSAEDVRTMLLDSFVRPLDWPRVVDALALSGVKRVLVAGPDSLFGRTTCTTSTFEVIAAHPRRAMTPRRRPLVA